ncbi:hypothetical protein [Candidatus Nitrospira bockiana]
MDRRLTRRVRAAVRRVFDRLDYHELAPIYCDEGGEAFWRDRRGPCEQAGVDLANVLLGRLQPRGRSLYVGAGVAELPLLVMETLQLKRTVHPFNLRAAEVDVLNEACAGLPFRVVPGDAASARGSFDHLWIVSVLNDPERFPELSALSYGRAHPALFDARRFERERTAVRTLVNACLRKLSPPALVSTSVEELCWIAEWCGLAGVPYDVGRERYPTALVEDPVCLIRIGRPPAGTRTRRAV